MPQQQQPQQQAAAAAASGGQGQDYSAQWAEYYRSIGKIEEAEAIEKQMKVCKAKKKKKKEKQLSRNISLFSKQSLQI